MNSAAMALLYSVILTKGIRAVKGEYEIHTKINERKHINLNYITKDDNLIMIPHFQMKWMAKIFHS